MAAQAAGLDSLSQPRLQSPITLVSSNHGCDESRQTPIRIKRTAIKLPVALAARRPRRTVVPQRVQWIHTDPWPPGFQNQYGARHQYFFGILVVIG
jgi:hypothetical protein